jgi:excinuclease UvrABC nuclease subunit
MDNTKAGGKPRDPRMVGFRVLARSAPESPGVYIMRNSVGEIIYVGKAKVLRNRLSSYFSGRKDVKTRHLVSRIDAIEWILAASEYEALLLENTLIKQHTPKYNINLKDGKSYPSVRVTNEEFPRVFRTRRIIRDGSLYFGPFPSAETVDIYLDLIKKLFPLRRCVIMRKRESPCMYYHIGRCSGPCAGKITREAYAEYVEEIKKLLSGETEALLAELREQDGSRLGRSSIRGCRQAPRLGERHRALRRPLQRRRLRSRGPRLHRLGGRRRPRLLHRIPDARRQAIRTRPAPRQALRHRGTRPSRASS